jgi:predicted SAM-dependent methyltransferase
MLLGLIRDIFSARKFEVNPEISDSTERVLNVGGGSKATPIPKHYDGWRHDLLDIDPRGMPDIVSDARELTKLNGGIYDAIYCSHNLEHYYRHDGVKVIRGFLHMLNETGFAEIRVPDIAWVISELRERQLELDDILYQSPAGPISAHDVIYGLQIEIENSGQDFYAHKTGFTPKSLVKMLTECGFQHVFLIDDEHLAVHAFAFKTAPTAAQHIYLGTSLSLASVHHVLK